MLTKDLLNFRIKAGRILPEFIGIDTESKALAEKMISCIKKNIGTTNGEMEEILGELNCSGARIFPALKKLIFDRLINDEDCQVVQDERWRAIRAGEEIRSDPKIAEYSEYKSAMEKSLGKDYQETKKTLYADLPLHRKIIGFKEITSEKLLHRYNTSLVQTFLLFANSVEVTISGASLAEKRRFFRLLKFHRLLSETNVLTDPLKENKEIRLNLSGPLNIFCSSQTYGINLANFFPHILHLPKWKLSAEVKLKNKMLSLFLDDTGGLVSHYPSYLSYIPVEFEHFIDNFNKRSEKWQARLSDDFFNLGGQTYCFPDITFSKPNNENIHLELFHRWHKGQLINRLTALERGGNKGLFIGVEKEIVKDQEIADKLNKSEWFRLKGFFFNDFPTPNALISLLDKTDL